MRRFLVPALLAASAAAGCSSGSGVSTSSILGTAPTPPPAAAPAQPGVVPVVAAAPSTPTERAFQVGTVSARAQKCGYNFDPAKLKASYMAHEIGLGASNDQVANIEKIYNVAYSGVTKAAAGEANYCSERKTQEIKTDLGRLLAGDFEPPKKAVAQKKDEGGLFDWFSGSSEDTGPKFGSSDWWDKQHEKTGG